MRRNHDQRLQMIEYKPESQREFVQKFNSKKKVAKRKGDKKKVKVQLTAPIATKKFIKKVEIKAKTQKETIEDNGTITNIEIQQLI